MQNYTKPVFYIGAASIMLNRHVDTVRRWCNSGKISHERDDMNGWRVFRLEEINRIRAKMKLPELSSQQAIKAWEEYHSVDEQCV